MSQQTTPDPRPTDTDWAPGSRKNPAPDFIMPTLTAWSAGGAFLLTAINLMSLDSQQSTLLAWGSHLTTTLVGRISAAVAFVMMIVLPLVSMYLRRKAWRQVEELNQLWRAHEFELTGIRPSTVAIDEVELSFRSPYETYTVKRRYDQIAFAAGTDDTLRLPGATSDRDGYVTFGEMIVISTTDAWFLEQLAAAKRTADFVKADPYGSVEKFWATVNALDPDGQIEAAALAAGPFTAAGQTPN